MDQHSHPDKAQPDRFLVCGLGSLGQHCVAILKEFGVMVSAIDTVAIDDWEIPHLPDRLSDLWIGDCRQTEILTRAQVQHCRGILLVTSDERVNVEAAFAARLINPQIRLVVRSAKQNLNQLLDQQLGNFVAFEPTQLSAPAFALAALGANASVDVGVTCQYEDELLGFFKIENELLQVVKRQIHVGDRWCNLRQLQELNSRTRRVLSHSPAEEVALESPPSITPLTLFHQWRPEAGIQADDILVTIELSQGLTSDTQRRQTATAQDRRAFSWQGWRSLLTGRLLLQMLSQWWQASHQHQIQRVAMLCLVTVLGLSGFGAILFSWHYPNLELLDAFYATAVLLLGGYGDLFSEFRLTIAIPWWLRLFGLGLTLAGTAFIGVLYALLIEKLLTWRLQFLAKRPPVPQQDHVVVIGMGRVGQRVGALLQTLKQPLVGITSTPLDRQILPQMPLVVGDLAHALDQVNLDAAKSVVAVSEDEMVNLEIGLMAHAANPTCGLAIRTYDRRFTDNVAQLFSYANVLSVSALSAEAFVGAAFGENVLSLFRLHDQTVLVTEYHIETGDTLTGLLLAEIAYGYGVVPIVHQRWPQAGRRSASQAGLGPTDSKQRPFSQDPPTFMPPDDVQLRVGDRLIVLATIAGLRRVERGELAPRCWQVQVEKAWTQDAAFAGAAEIARIGGCRLSMARELMDHLPGQLPSPLYQHQALHLVRRLKRLLVKAKVLWVEPES